MKKAIVTLAAIVGTMAAATVVNAAPVSQSGAQKTALEAAGLTADQVVFKPIEKNYDDGREIFEVDFFIPGQKKYEFDIDVNTGEIVDQDVDYWEADDYIEYGYLLK